jgi:hypothetical protein
MEVSNVSADVPTVRTGTASAPEQGTPSPAPVAPPADFADIRPLDIPGALQILLAEVRAALDLQVDASITPSEITSGAAAAGTIAQSPVHAARELVEIFLQALPEDASDAPVWTAALLRADTTMQSGIEQAIGVVTQWRDVPAAVVDAVADARALFISALGDDPQSPLWLRPDWMGLVPIFHRFRRRRRNARRRLTDPDYSPQSLDESEEFR